MKYLIRSWVRRCFMGRSLWSAGRRSLQSAGERRALLQLETLEDRTTPSFVGVKMLELVPGPSSSFPKDFTEVNGIVYFSALDDTGFELWRTDGTTAGTYRVADINPGPGSSYPRELTNVNGKLVFRATDGDNGYELWIYDPASNNLQMVDIRSGPESSYPAHLFFASDTANGTLFFSAHDGTHEEELWKSDGTVAGTVLVKDINDGFLGSGSSSPQWFADVNGIVYFRAFRPASGHELWRTDGTEGGTWMVSDIRPGGGSSFPEFLTNVNGTLFFSATHDDYGRSLWKSDGTAEGTVLVWDPATTSENVHFGNFINVGGTLFFTADDGSGNNVELWKSDSTTEGTVLVRDINPSGQSLPRYLTNINGTLYFVANDGTHGDELWKSNGTEEGTVLVADINPASADVRYLTNVNGMLFFSAIHPTYGRELWMSDGTAVGTVVVADINSGANSDPRYLANVNGTLFFRASRGSSDGHELFRTAIATTLTITSGNNQSTTVGTAFSSPLVVRVLDQFGEPMEGVPVAFTAPSSGASAVFGSSHTITVTTDANGLAQVTPVANTIAGTYTVTASVNSLTASFTLTNNPDAPAALQIVSGNNQNTTVNTAFGSPLVVQLVDQYGNAVSQSGVSVTFTAPSSGASATLNSSTVNTDANGQAQVTATANTIAGSYQVQVTSGSLTGVQFSLTNNPAAPAALQIVSGNNQNTTVNTTFGSPLVVEVRDQYGNPVPNVNVTFTAPSSGASALFGGNSTITVTTDANGQASVNADANTTAGSYNVTASVGSLSVNFALTNVAGPIAAVQFRIQPPTSVSVGQRFRVQVVLLDQYGNVVKRPNTGVRLSLRAGSGLSGTLVKQTSIYGLATFGDLVLSAPGRYRLVARLGNGLQVISRAIRVV